MNGPAQSAQVAPEAAAELFDESDWIAADLYRLHSQDKREAERIASVCEQEAVLFRAWGYM